MLKYREAWNARLIALLLFVGTVLLFLPVIGFNFTNYDDTYYVTENPAVRAGLSWQGVKWAFSNAQTGNWHPITWLTHMLDSRIYQLHAGGHHFTNVLFHAGTSVVILFFLRTLTKAMWPSAAVAVLFALHPLHVESVAWVAERKDVLSGFFGMMSIWAYSEYARRRELKNGNARAPWWYALSFALLALGLMSKAMLVTWPFVMLLLDYWPLGRIKTNDGCIRSNLSLVLEKVPMFALSLADCVVTLVAQKQAGAVASLSQLPFGARLENAMVVYAGYLQKFLWPADLAVIYPQVQHWPIADLAVALILLAGVTAAAWWQRKQRPFLLVGWFWFLGTLVPVIGLVQAGNQALADRYMYLPSIGLLIAVSWGVADFGRTFPNLRPAVWFCSLAALCSCALATRVQLQYWRNSETLFRRAVAVTRNNAVAWNSLGFNYADLGDFRQARECFESALAIDPENPYAWSGMARIAVAQGETAAAINAGERALRANPKLADAETTLGLAMMKQGQTADAITHYAAAAALRPDSAVAQYNLANALARAGQLPRAAESYRNALVLDSTSASTHSNFGYVLDRLGHREQAADQFRAALAIEPDYWQARYGLADVLARLGRTQEAVRLLTALVQQKPELSPPKQRLAEILATNQASK